MVQGKTNLASEGCFWEHAGGMRVSVGVRSESERIEMWLADGNLEKRSHKIKVRKRMVVVGKDS